MRHPTLVWSLAGLNAAFLVVGALLGVPVLPWGIPALTVVLVGGFLLWRVPQNRIGVLFMTTATAWSVGVLLLGVAHAVADPDISGLFDALGNALSTAGVMALPIALLRFPDGRLLSRRWQSAVWLAMATAVLGGAAALLNGGWGGDVDQAVALSPLRASSEPLGDVLSSVFFPMMLGSFLIASFSLILRYGRSQGDDRQKMKWLAYSGGFVVFAFVAVVLSGNWQVQLAEGWQASLMAVAFASVPASVGVAILKYRLYDIDIVISRTVVLAVLAVFITVVYAVVVVAIGDMIGGESDGLLLPIAATAIVAIAFEPVRNTAQKWANRLVYGRRATPYEVLSDLTARLSHGEDGSGLLHRLAIRLGDGTGAERATIWLGEPGTMRVAASWPSGHTSASSPDLNDPQVFLVTHDDHIVGALEVVKPRGSELSTSEYHLVEDLAGSAGAVLGYQRLNDSLRAKAEELAESRVRLVDAQDEERRRLERDLHDGAQQLIVALKVKIGLARAMAAKHDEDQLVNLLEGLSEEAQAALDEVRALAKGIYPPVLESDGLGPAIAQLADGVPGEVLVEVHKVGRYRRDVEAAVYFDISEALTNAVKHGVEPYQIEVVGTDDGVEFSVVDQGPGFDTTTANGGSGLQNLRDRVAALGGHVEIDSQPGRGTRVAGKVPTSELVSI